MRLNCRQDWNVMSVIDRLHIKVVFSNLTSLSIHSCHRLRFLLSFSVAKSLVELKRLEVSRCEIMEEIVSTRNQSDEETIDNMFCKLESLTLDKLPNLTRFCARCKKLDVKSETVVQNCLFDAQVKFPSLEKLEIRELRKLQSIWNNQLADQDSFCRLREVYVSGCISLQNIFPASIAIGLQNLYKLTLRGCDEVEEIIVGEERRETTPPLFVFPKVTSVRFYNMPKLSRFYPGMHASKWPLLKDLFVIKCDKVKIFAAELPIFGEKHEVDYVIEQSLFLIDKDSFPNLEKLWLGVVEIWYGPSPPHFASKLKSIQFCLCPSLSKQAALVFLHKLVKLQNLDTLEVGWNDWEEIFVNEEGMNSGGEMEKIHAVGSLTLPRVKYLWLSDMEKLLHLGNYQNYQLAGPLFPNLETLQVHHCSKLKSLESSAISFRNLTTLDVRWCRGLEYLTTYSVAKSLWQLTRTRILSSPRGERLPHQAISALHFEMEGQDCLHFWGGVWSLGKVQEIWAVHFEMDGPDLLVGK